MARLRLDPPPEPDVTIIGISSHVHDYRLCWALNRSMGLELARRATDIVDDTKHGPAHYAVFDHADPETEASYTLVSNNGRDGRLIKDQRQANYFLIVDAEEAERRPALLDHVLATEFVLTAFPLTYKELRAGHKLLL